MENERYKIKQEVYKEIVDKIGEIIETILLIGIIVFIANVVFRMIF